MTLESTTMVDATGVAIVPSQVADRSANTDWAARPVHFVAADAIVADDLEQLRRTVELAEVEPGSDLATRRHLDPTVPVMLATEGLAIAAASALSVVSLGAPVLTVAVLAAAQAAVRLSRGSARPRMLLSVVDDLGIDLRSAVGSLGVTFAVLSVIGDNDVSSLLLSAGIFLVTTIGLRTAAFAELRRSRRSASGGRRTLIIGTGTEGVHIAEGLQAKPELGLTPVGFLDDDPALGAALTNVPLLSNRMDQLADLIVDHDISTVITTFVDDDSALIDVLLTSTRLDTEIYVVPRLYELASDDVKTQWVDGIPLVRHKSGITSTASWKLKRVFDASAAAFALVLLAPVLLAAAAAVYIDGGPGVLFRQRRIGIDGQAFELFKFRSMRPVDELEQQTTWNIGEDPRVSSIGRFLRRTSIDELPQLLNILRGDMSVVGPRPERPVFVEQFSAEHSRYWARHRFPVGLTGWAQVNGLRGDTSIAQRARFDNYYIANWSLALDLKIVLLTVREVLRGSGR